MDDPELIQKEEVELLESLERDGVLSKGATRRIRVAIRIGNAAIKSRNRILLLACLLNGACLLVSAAIAFSSTTWLSVLLCLFAFVSFMTFVGMTIP